MNYWITIKEVGEIASVDRNVAGRIIRQVNAEQAKKGLIIPTQRKAPRHIVLKRLGIEEHGTNTTT